MSEREPGLSHTWMDSLHGSRPLKSVWVISCQRRGEQQQIGLLKQFSSTGGLLSACQLPDYSIQLFCCSQSAQRAPRARPHGYLSIPDILAYILLLHKDNARKVTGSVILCSNTFSAKQPQTKQLNRKKRLRGRLLSSVKPVNFQCWHSQFTAIEITSNS